MSEAATTTPETGADAGAATTTDNGSFLGSVTEGSTPPVDAEANEAAAKAASNPDTTTAEGIQQEVANGPPEGLNEKFWDAEGKRIKVDDLVKSYSNLEKLLGTEKVPVPQSDEDEEGYERWIAAVRPEDETKYDFGEPPKDLPNGLEYDEELETAYRQAALANGLHPRQAKGLYDMFLKGQIDKYTEYNRMVGEQKANLTVNLQREYGAQFPAVMKGTGAVMDKYADPEFRAFLDESGLGNDARMVRMLYNMHRDLGGETKLVNGNAEPERLPADLDAAISSFRSKNSKALADREHPDNQRLVNELAKLYEARHPGAAA